LGNWDWGDREKNNSSVTSVKNPNLLPYPQSPIPYLLT